MKMYFLLKNVDIPVFWSVYQRVGSVGTSDLLVLWTFSKTPSVFLFKKTDAQPANLAS